MINTSHIMLVIRLFCAHTTDTRLEINNAKIGLNPMAIAIGISLLVALNELILKCCELTNKYNKFIVTKRHEKHFLTIKYTLFKQYIAHTKGLEELHGATMPTFVDIGRSLLSVDNHMKPYDYEALGSL